MATTGVETMATKPSQTPIREKSAIMQSVEDILYGSIAGIVGKYIEYPFDTVKVRLQSQPDHLPLRYTGPLDCFRQSFRADGFLGLYRGISAPLFGAAAETSSLFFFERIGREAVYASGYYSRDRILPLSALWFTGAFAGAFTSVVLTPIELVKCKIQVPATTDGSTPKPPTVTSVIREVYKHEGVKGFWRGQLGTFFRESGGCAAWFGSKETVTKMFYLLNEKNAKSQLEKDALATEALPIWQQAVAGASAGMSYNFLFFPADTIKSRMQTSPVGGSGQNSTFWQEGKALWNQHGLKGLYRGCGITVLRSAPSSAFIFIVFDSLKRYLPM
ncbi:mitochondrial carrier [Annulohypoxylon maeteangense]|uniref:mitochondrial carrier n=1 Tax=Annulohypoxylon maeteangense TaxID=1927788 RepID=UPI0020074B88|nr:mitochondrial carrier [Annulohypoxylon maeteangense]KAI0890427.1 mitochondrial carrier [Annulohypoxylon maeteangense]